MKNIKKAKGEQLIKKAFKKCELAGKGFSMVGIAVYLIRQTWGMSPVDALKRVRDDEMIPHYPLRSI